MASSGGAGIGRLVLMLFGLLRRWVGGFFSVIYSENWHIDGTVLGGLSSDVPTTL